MSVANSFSSSARFHALRLSPQQEVFSALQSFIATRQIKAAWIAGCTGSLGDVALRYAGQEQTTRMTGVYEVISLSGTLEPGAGHLHLSLADPQGAMLGGHMMPGCAVRTTLELIIGELTSLSFSRQPCPLSGYDELVVAHR